MHNLKNKAINAVVWASFDKIANQGLSFVFGIFLARIVTPADYGLIGMLSVFISLSQVFIAGNFMTALIQKKERSPEDINTVFIFNILSSSVLYIILFFSADLIANFYGEPRLGMLTRVLSTSILLYSLSLVQSTLLSIELNFKRQALISITSISVSGIIGVMAALNGLGVWALVWRTVSAAVITTTLLWLLSSWKPDLRFSRSSFMSLFNYSYKLVIADVFDSIYRNINNILIGKYYGAISIGYYLRAKQLQDLPSVTITEVVQKVSFSAFSSIQDDPDRIFKSYRKVIRLTFAMVVFLMFSLMAVAHPLIILLLTSKWLPSVEYFQILCFAGIWFPVDFLAMNIILLKGLPGLFLKVDILKKIISLTLVTIAIPFGVKALVYSLVVVGVFSFIINIFVTRSLIAYTLEMQLKDVIPILIVGIISAYSSGIVMSLAESDISQLLLGILSYIVLFIFLARFFNIISFEELVLLIRPVFAGKVNNSKGKSELEK